VFTSLDRADIVLKPGADGRRQFVQTDHRTAAEIEQERELSTLVALIRVLNPKRMREPGEPEPVVLYSAQERPPEFLQRVIHVAGGQLLVGDSREPEAWEGHPTPLDEVIESAFVSLAQAVAAEFGVSVNAAGLASIEDRLAESAGDPEEDEFAYWSAVLKLGGFGGEVIRAANSGRWSVTDTGTLPLNLMTRFEGGEATVNPLGKAIKRFNQGEGDSVASLVGLLLSQP
jgi:hypothetical protein